MVSVFDQGPPAPCPAPFNLAEHVLTAGAAPDAKIALAVLGPYRAERWSYGKLRAAVRGVGTGLLRQGLKPGDIVLMRIGNTPDFPIAYLGAIAAGIVPVPTSAQLTAPEVAVMLDQLAPAAILKADGLACPKADIPVIPLAEMSAWYDLPPCDWDRGDPERLAYIVYTSGTSGVPCAVCHAHRAIWARRMMIDGWYGLTPEDRVLHAGAFNWTFTLGTGLLDPWSLGATALIPADGVDHAQIPLLMRRHEATIFAAAPGVYRAILKRHAKLDLPKLRHGLAAGEKLAAPIRAAWEAATGTAIFEAYGMSECSTFVSGAPARPARDAAIGRPQPGRRVAILGPDGPVPFDTPGEIAVHADDPGLMLGYFGAEAETRARFRGDWFVTGDQGAMSEDGQITYLGRGDDMMNAGGYRVSPLEVEAAFLAHPGIEECGATDIEVKEGVRLIALSWTGPATIPEAELQAWGAARLARYKQPRFFHHREALPKNPNGKLIRKALRDTGQA
ncbi:Long-chain-fatty-acid--CoA ligase [Roseivivax sp. THAF40]|uniref:class I adenylate-forming enzyme family protein n=1 Tax=unclassified Roseivivax TaxID=2639302 RepID=UPI0012688988|nr:MULTISPECIES: class I adenylate-forming enzyme family protein [unclassified Roseivivax]QFS83187.1 Long-chain-fatty-acid--CoA ligase [Roseivivax sp. THAF197b]QFT46931.1 Long-chain-fatty-acid--CoA ligase [Roseivivax sp. THAF40]